MLPASSVARVGPRVLLFLGLCSLGGLHPSTAQPAPLVLRLDTLLAEVRRANPSLQAARLEAAARAQVGAQVAALPDPVVSVTAFPFPILTAFGAQRTQWRVEQRTPWPGTRRLRAEAANHAAAAAQHDAEALALDLALGVQQAYYALIQLDRTEIVLQAYQERLAVFTEATLVRYEVGQGTQGAALQLSLERDRLTAQRQALGVRRAAALQQLARLTDRPALAHRPAALTLDAPPWPAPSSPAVPDLLQRRPEAQGLRANAERAATETALAHQAFYPDLGLGLTYVDVAPRDRPATADGTDALGITVSARVPLQRGRLRARVAETRLRQQQVEARQAALRTAIETEVAVLTETLRREAETVALYRSQLLPQATATAESVRAAYTTGQVSYTAFLDAERTRFQLQLALEEAHGRYLHAHALLDRALGTHLPSTPTSR
ncbi:MAG: TolC family protein [Bacteroidota bacterium]